MTSTSALDFHLPSVLEEAAARLVNRISNSDVEEDFGGNMCSEESALNLNLAEAANKKTEAKDEENIYSGNHPISNIKYGAVAPI